MCVRVQTKTERQEPAVLWSPVEGGGVGGVRWGTQRCLERKRLREAEKETQKQTRREKQRQRDTLGREENRERK